MLHAPVLQLNADRMHKIDPRNVENLFGMWTVFSKCANTIPDGKRLENLSWRVWARETLCCPPQPEKTIIPIMDSRRDDTPSLSHSFSSGSDNESVSTLENSALSKSRGKETHLTTSTLGRIINYIQEQQTLEPLDPEMEACLVAKIAEASTTSENATRTDQIQQQPLDASAASSCISTMRGASPDTERESLHRSSDTSVNSDGLIRSGSVVHGFSPLPSLKARGSCSISRNLPTFVKSTANGPVAKKTAMFMMGGSSEDDDSSFDQSMSYRRTMLEPRKSSLSKSMSRDSKSLVKKTTSFREIVEQHTFQAGASPAYDNAIASDDEEDDEEDDSVLDDSAVEDSEEGWEDEQPEEERGPVHPVFKRVDSSANLPSRRSILTAGLTEGDRATGLLNAAIGTQSAMRGMQRSVSHSGPFMPASPEQEDEGIMMMPSAGSSRAIPVNNRQSSSAAYAIAQSPRSTRRNMLSTELTESLRKSLLWERQQKNTTVNAFLKREARSMANLQRAGQNTIAEHPEQLQTHGNATHSSDPHNDYYNAVNGYHATGW